MKRGPCGPFLFDLLLLWRNRATGSTKRVDELVLLCGETAENQPDHAPT